VRKICVYQQEIEATEIVSFILFEVENTNIPKYFVTEKE
jgi:hypothetical protein